MQDTTLLVGDTHPEYVGNWYYHNEQSEPESYRLNLLKPTMTHDGHASYLKCEMSNDTRGNSSIKKRYSRTTEEARVIGISVGDITIEQHWEFLYIENVLHVPSRPFTEGGAEYLYVEGYKLMKIKKEINVVCPES